MASLVFISNQESSRLNCREMMFWKHPKISERLYLFFSSYVCVCGVSPYFVLFWHNLLFLPYKSHLFLLYLLFQPYKSLIFAIQISLIFAIQISLIFAIQISYFCHTNPSYQSSVTLPEFLQPFQLQLIFFVNLQGLLSVVSIAQYQ